MSRRLLTRWAARYLSSVAHERRESARDAIRAKAQSMRRALGLPDHPSLTTKEN